MRTVLASHSEVAHYWANHIQQEGRASNVFFEGNSIFSYGHHFEMARFMKDNIIFFNNDTYSVSTSKHQSITRRAIPEYCKVFTVSSFDNHSINIENYLDQIKIFQLKASRAKTLKTFYLDRCKKLIYEVIDYLDIFKVKGLSSATKKLIRKLTNNVKEMNQGGAICTIYKLM